MSFKNDLNLLSVSREQIIEQIYTLMVVEYNEIKNNVVIEMQSKFDNINVDELDNIMILYANCSTLEDAKNKILEQIKSIISRKLSESSIFTSNKIENVMVESANNFVNSKVEEFYSNYEIKSLTAKVNKLSSRIKGTQKEALERFNTFLQNEYFEVTLILSKQKVVLVLKEKENSKKVVVMPKKENIYCCKCGK
ncbi:MAG: hypothetical protein IJZ29_05505 [Clostridia bacterium]|nr:hypothetical protein [Clostridia bacterium]